MIARRTTIRSSIFLAATVVAMAAPATGAANPLLSGYGGPGQGAQAIIGGGLVNPPGGGGGSGTTATTSGLTVSATPAATAPGGSAAGSSRHRAATRPARKHAAAKASPAAPPGVAAVRPAPETSGGSSGALGLSGGDALLILFVLAGLTGTALLTRQLTRRTP